MFDRLRRLLDYRHDPRDDLPLWEVKCESAVNPIGLTFWIFAENHEDAVARAYSLAHGSGLSPILVTSCHPVDGMG